MRRPESIALFLLLLLPAGFSAQAAPPPPVRLALHDAARDRDVPVVVYLPYELKPKGPCNPPKAAAAPCPVALISPGYEGSADAYGFIAALLNARGYLVVGVQHDLPGDAPLPQGGNLWEARSPMWARGAQNLRFAMTELARRYPGFDWRRPLLVGHSMGGDISVWMAREQTHAISGLITLDQRRVPFANGAQDGPRTLTLRSSDQPADPGVLPMANRSICVVPLPGALHNDMHDGGPPALRQRIAALIADFLAMRPCPSTPDVPTP